MKTTSATEAKQNFGRILEESLVEPVVIKRSGRVSAVLLSHREYERLLGIEESYWIARARDAESSGFLDEARSMKRLTGLIASSDD
ncbi:MAG: type II toxin-antitoxin system Phd/YefM family antitoxin [Thermovirgaceae bacterium]|nr:type II toxin-antitoxin system Phd/YefM family antitoxin [Thermovirgaceae bacterium]